MVDLVSIGYFRELAADLNMTRTAARLFISQQTLSNHIRRVEQHYGTPLFHRRPSLALTDAGQQVLAFAQSLEFQEANLRDALGEIIDQTRGVLRLGAGSVRGSGLLPLVLPEYGQRFPNVRIEFTDAISEVATAMVGKGELDLAVTLDGDHPTEIIARHLYREQVYAVIPESLLTSCLTRSEMESLRDEDGSGIDVGDLARLPLSVMDNQLGRRVTASLRRTGVELSVRFSGTASAQTIPLARAGLAACYCTQLPLLGLGDQLGGLIVLPILEHGEPIHQDINLIRHKDRFLPHHAAAFIDRLEEVAVGVEQATVVRLG